MEQIFHTTPGPYIVGTTKAYNIEFISVVTSARTSKAVALTGVAGAADESESIANAALFAIAPDMLDALIAISETINADVPLDVESINAMISDVFAKLANEAGEEVEA